MSPIRKLLFVGVGVLALHGLQACASETELNPQPLPPRGVGGGENTPVPAPEDKTGDMAGSSGSSSGTSGTPSSAADGGPDGDADGSGDADDAGVH